MMDSRVGSGNPLLKVPRGVEDKWGQGTEDIPLEVIVTQGEDGVTLFRISPSYTSRMLLRALKNNNEESTDAAIVLNNKVQRVHSWVLSTFSTAMKAAFYHTPQIFQAPTKEADLIASMVDCMYGKTTAIRESQLCRFLGVARQLGMTFFDTPGLRTLEDKLLARDRRCRAGKLGGQADVQDDPVLKHKESLEELVHQQENKTEYNLWHLPGITLTAVNDKPILHDLSVANSQTERGTSDERPQQKDKKQCCCSCSCKKKTEDTSGAAPEAEESVEKPYSQSLAVKLKTLGTTISGQGAISGLPSWMFSSNSLSITPVAHSPSLPSSTPGKPAVTTKAEKPEIMAHYKIHRSHQQDSPRRVPHPYPPIDQPGRHGRDVGKDVMPSGVMVDANHCGQKWQHGVGTRNVSNGVRPGEERPSQALGRVRPGGGLGEERPSQALGGVRPGGGLGGVRPSQALGGVRPGGGLGGVRPSQALGGVRPGGGLGGERPNQALGGVRPGGGLGGERPNQALGGVRPGGGLGGERPSQALGGVRPGGELGGVRPHGRFSSVARGGVKLAGQKAPEVIKNSAPVSLSRIPQLQRHSEHIQHQQNIQQPALPAKVSLPGVAREHQKPSRGQKMRGRGRYGRGCPPQEDVEAVLQVPVKSLCKRGRGRPKKSVPVHHSQVVDTAETSTNNLFTLDEADSFEIVDMGLIMQLEDGAADILQGTVLPVTVQLPESLGPETSTLPQLLQHTQHQDAVGPDNSATPQPLQHTQQQEVVGPQSSATQQPVQHTQHQEAEGPESNATPQPLQHTQQEVVRPQSSATQHPLQHTQHQEAEGPESSAAPQTLQHTQHQDTLGTESSAAPHPLQHTHDQEAMGSEKSAAPQPVQHTQPPISSEQQGLAPDKTRDSNFGSSGERSNFEGFFVSDEESVQDRETAVFLPSQPGPSSSVVQQHLGSEEELSSLHIDSEEELPPLHLDSKEVQLSLHDTQGSFPQPPSPVRKTTPAKKHYHTCPTCHLSFSTPSSLLLHRRQHNGQGYLHCSSCPFYHCFRQHLECHVRKKHGRKLMDTEKKRVRAATVSPGSDQPPKKKAKKEESPKKRKLRRVVKRK